MNKILGLLLGSIISIPIFACDICGCAGMSVGFGDLSFFNQHKIGVRYSLRQFDSPLGSNDFFSQIDLNGSYVINEKWSLSATVPYLSAQRTSVEVGNTDLSGLGDVTIKANYYLWRYSKNELNTRLSVNAGLNLPTGKFVDRDGSFVPQNFQIGTGGIDYLLESQLQVGVKNWVGLLQGRYLINTINREAYKFGNQAGLQAIAAYKIPLTKIALVPMINLSYEHFDKDLNSRGLYQFGTGGDSFSLLAGIQLKAKSWLWSIRGGSNISQTGSNDYRPGLQFYLSTNYLF